MNKTVGSAVGVVVLTLNAGWLWAFPEPSLFYVGNVLLHIGLGAILALLFVLNRELLAELRGAARGRPALLVLAVCFWTGSTLAVVGATRPYYGLVVAHGAAGFVGVALAAWFAAGRYPRFKKWSLAALAVALALPAGEALRSRFVPDAGAERVVNPTVPPLSMEEEGGGADSPFFPSSATTNVGGRIPSDFFMDSKACGECHKDVYEQWAGSTHHFASFNNQFYRKAIEYMQATAGVEPSKWCAGCHDHAMLFNGMFERPVAEQLDAPEAHAGLGCMSCHSITQVRSTMGNGDFEMTYPPLHELTTSSSPVVHAIGKYVTETAPAAHRKAFLKPFMRLDAAEFCSACHKVHLDKPVNNYRWFRGFNSYDNWQASGVSGQGARSFYYPERPKVCNDCHMPLVPSNDPGNRDGYVRSHRFAAANTAVPYVNRDQEQLQAVIDFLQDDIVSLDLFAAAPIGDSPTSPAARRAPDEGPRAATTFAVGEEAAGGGSLVFREVDRLAAPLDVARPKLEPGSTVRLDVVVRTKNVGHFFPTGTVDAFDVWIELQAEDAAGRPIFWSGGLLDGEGGDVEKGAHFYRSVMLDARGNGIDKRNAFHARATLYARLIPPGAADVVRYRLKVPEEVEGPIRVRARLRHRKFAASYTRFAWAGEPVGEGEYGKDFDDRRFTYSPADIPENVSGEIKDRIPEPPIVTLAAATAEIAVGEGPTEWETKTANVDPARWNDYGIGLLLQGDIRGARHAFLRVTEAAPEFADGWLNVARALIQEGQTEAAKPYIERALAIDDSLARSHFFQAMIEKADGDYDAALASLRRAEEQYPRDRVVLNQAARILFLERRYEEALGYLERVARIDPEDLQMHYTAMLCYRGLGREEEARREQALFERFKADEDAQVVSADLRRGSPEDNNEAQAVHEHVSVDLRGVVAFPADSPAQLSMTGAGR